MSVKVTDTSTRNNETKLYETMGKVSDGYHTFDELYEHRIVLFIALMKSYPNISWYSYFHADGTRWEGWIIAGMHLPTGDITYHLPREWEDEYLADIERLEKAPEWDGHTPKDVLERLKEWAVDPCENDD